MKGEGEMRLFSLDALHTTVVLISMDSAVIIILLCFTVALILVWF